MHGAAALWVCHHQPMYVYILKLNYTPLTICGSETYPTIILWLEGSSINAPLDIQDTGCVSCSMQAGKLQESFSATNAH